jgi:hypothetical protein
MKTNQKSDTSLVVNSSGLGKVTRRVVRERAVELALSHGRSAQEVSKADWEQAKRDLMVEPVIEPKETSEELVADSEGWAPAPGSEGHKVHVPSGDDEDDEGRSDTERMVERGVEQAGRERADEANRDAQENE